MARRVDSLRCQTSDAIGAKRTCGEGRERIDLTKMTRCCRSGVPRSIEFTISTLGARHERRQRCAKQDGASRQLIHLKASIRLDVVFARDRPPQSHLLSDELPKLFRAAQRERHLLGLIELL